MWGEWNGSCVRAPLSTDSKGGFEALQITGIRSWEHRQKNYFQERVLTMGDHSDDIGRPLSSRVEAYAGVGGKPWSDDLTVWIASKAFIPSRSPRISRAATFGGTAGAWLAAYGAFGSTCAAELGGNSIVRTVGV